MLPNAVTSNERSSRMGVTSEFELLRRSRAAAKQRSADRGRENVVEIKMQLAEETDASAAGMVHRKHGLRADLEIGANPDHPGIDRTRGDRAIAKIVCPRGVKLHF